MRPIGKRINLISIELAACLSLSFLATHPAMANMLNFTKMPGNNCRALEGKQSGDISADNGRSTNTSNSNRQIICPMPLRDDSKSYSGIFVRVFAEDNSPTETVSCTLHGRDLYGRSVHKENKILDTSPSGSMVAGGPGFMGHAFAKYELKDLIANNETFYIWCRLPPNSSVLSYDWGITDSN
jgi:hypothetical protein